MNQRQQRVADLLRRELSEIIRTEVRDPRVGLASVSDFTVGRDLSHAKVRISVLGEEDERLACIEALNRAKGFMRSLLARRVRLRTVPELFFELDRGAEHSQRINEILEGLQDGEQQEGGQHDGDQD